MLNLGAIPIIKNSNMTDGINTSVNTTFYYVK